MCGIYGIAILRNGKAPDPAWLATMGRVTTHRGPDDEGQYADAHVALGMRRLSIIDLSSGHQPIANEDETVWVVCNGEIYNFRELRAELEAKGHRFRTHSDTEVLVHLYEEHGLGLVKHLEGMFGFALWDIPRRRLIVARDQIGIKPVYYRRDSDRLIFASEAKAILTVPGVDAGIDPAAVEEYLTLGYTPPQRSIFAGIEKLPPATMMVLENGELRFHEYWRLPAGAGERLSAGEWEARVRDQLERSVAAEMVSDVPLGAFLSGGIDSSSIVAMMARHSDRPVKTYSIGFDTGSAGAFYNELPYAKEVSTLFGTEHREILVRPDVSELLPKLLWHMDEPVADSAFITTYLVSQFAREDVTVILSGVGGDELFGGYRRYLGDYYMGHYRRIPAWLRRALIVPIARRLPSDRHSPLMNLSRYARTFVLSGEQPFEERYRSYVEVFDEATADRLYGGGHRCGPDALSRAFEVARDSDPLWRMMHVDMLTQLPNDLLMLTDKMTMAASIECRVPLLSRRLVELAAVVPSELKVQGRDLKHILKQVLADVLPKSILYRKKRGFGAPMGAWLKSELSPLMKYVLSQESVERRGWFDWTVVGETIALHETNREDHTDHLQSLMNLEIWARLYLDKRSPDDLTAELKSEAVR